MFNGIRRFFTAPVFEDEDKTRTAGLLFVVLRAVLMILAVLIPATLVINLTAGISPAIGLITLSIGGAAFLGLFILARGGHIRLSSLILSLTMLALVTSTLATSSIRNPAAAGYIVAIITAGLLLGGRAAVGFAALCLVILFGLYAAETNGTWVASSTPTSEVTILMTYVSIFSVVALMLSLAARSIVTALERARHNERVQIELNRELQALQTSLEQTVAKRTAQLNVSAEVGRAITSVLDPDDLIGQVAQLITDRFNFYYAAIFLIDEFNKFAILRDATGRAGQLLKGSGHRLEIGGHSMVSAAITKRKPYVAGRVGNEQIRFANPLLPETQSEIALPLVVGDRVLGALDVQSTQPDAFDEATQAVLQSLADQIAIALNNARQFQSAQMDARQATALFQASQLASNITEDLGILADRLLSTVAQQAGFDSWTAVTFDAESNACTTLAAHHPHEVAPLDSVNLPIIIHGQADAPTAMAIRLGQPVIINDPDIDPLLRSLPVEIRSIWGRSVSVPASLGDRTVGAISLGRTIDQPSISAREVQLAQAVASQLAVTLENRRLLEQARTAVAELNELMHRYTREGWSRFSQLRQASILQEFSRPDAEPLDPSIMRRVDQVARLDTLAPVQANGQAMIAIPIALRGEVIGTLGVQDDTERRWSEDELATLRAVADQVAQSVEVARLLNETEASLHETTELYKAGQAITTAQTLDDILRAFTDHVIATELDRCVMTLVDPAGPPGDTVVEVVAESVTIGDQRRALGQRWSVAGNPWMNSEPFVINDLATALMLDDMTRHTLLNETGVKAQTIIPLLVGRRPIGWLLIQSSLGPYEFSEGEIRLYRTLAGQAAAAIENRRLFEETQRRVEIEAALNQISHSIRSSLDPQAVLDLQATIGEMGRLMRASRSFYLASDDDLRFTFAYEWCAPDVLSFKGASGLWADMPEAFNLLRIGQPIVAEAIERDSPPDLRVMVRARGVVAHLYVPILVGNRLIGVLGLDQVDRQRRWTADEIALMQRIADQLAAALDNARLYQNVRARVNELTALTRIGRRLAATLDLEEVLNTIVEEAINVTPADRGSIALYDNDQDALEIRVMIGYPEQSLQRLREGGLQMLRRGNGLHGRLLVTRQAVLSNDVQQDADYLTVDDATRSELIVPIKQGEFLLGALNLESPRPYAFGEPDQRLIEALADQAAVAIVNARAYASERAALERMREVDRLKTQFLANMSHELRTPLNSIIGFSRVILRGIDGPLTELQQADLTAIHNSGQHLLGLINDILDLSKIEAGKMELSLEDMDLADVVKGVMSTAIALVKDKSVELRQEVPADLPAIRADARRIRQVILNLVSNAAKFTEQGRITTRVELTPREVEVSVIDTGIGIPADKLEHVFEEFTQVDASTTRRAGGTGLGLAISRRFVEMHGGRMWVESKLGAGSRFAFNLPLERPVEPPEEDGSEVAPVPGKKVVLSIDDDGSVITLYKRYLEKQGYQVIGLLDATRAVDEARRLNPMAITLDVLMPNRDGWSTLADLKSTPDTSRIPIIVCSIIQDESKGFSLGAADYLVKPIAENELLRALERANRNKATQTVLVIDDEPEAIRLVRRMLEAWSGYKVLEAIGGAQGIASVQAQQPDLVILDLMMPDIDGFAVLETIKSNRSTQDTPIVVVTAKDLTEEDRRRLQGKTVALLNKGMFDSERLLNEISAALNRIDTDGAAADKTITSVPAVAGHTPAN